MQYTLYKVQLRMYIWIYIYIHIQRRSVYLCLPRLVISLYLWLHHPRSLHVNQGSRVVKEGGGGGPPWSPQNDLRSLLLRRMTSRPRKTVSVPLAMCPSFRHSVSTPRISVSACCGPEGILWIKRLGGNLAGLMAALHPLPPSSNTASTRGQDTSDSDNIIINAIYSELMI